MKPGASRQLVIDYHRRTVNVTDMRRAARKDGNHNDVAKWLREMGATVIETHQIGGGFPDLLVQCGKTFAPAEVKDPSQKPSDRKLTDDQVAWWKRHGIEPVILETLDDCARFIHTVATRRNS